MDRTEGVAWGNGHGAAYHRHLCTAAGTDLRKSHTHLTGGVVTDEAHRVDRFLGTTGGDEYPLTGEGTGRERIFERFLQFFRFRHTAFANDTAGQGTFGGFDHAYVLPTADGLDGMLRSRVLPHLIIHRGGNEDRFAGDATADSGRQRIVGDAGSHLGYHIRRGRSYDHRVAPFG